jgi:hypothetical protein
MDDLVTKLQRGPAVLFLGQNYLALETDSNPFLDKIAQKYGKEQNKEHYDILFNKGINDFLDSSIPWINTYIDRLSIPEWLKTVSKFPWSNVYTSAIDTMWLRSFRQQNWRQLVLIFEEKYNPLDNRNPFDLHSTFLFGCINQIRGSGTPPFNKFNWTKRKHEAITLARRIPDILSPLGVLVIDGYTVYDWFSLDDFLPIFDELQKNQVFIFSASDDLIEDPIIKHFVENEIIHLKSENLGEYLQKQYKIGNIRFGPSINQGERYIQIGKKIIDIPSDIWNQVSRSALIVDDSVLTPVKKVGEEKLYRNFLNFLAASSIHPVWEGYKNNFAFERDFEKELMEIVETQLVSKELHDKPIILHGQSGTGKTVALGRLAYSIKNKKKFAVLYIERRPKKPSYEDFDAFSKWAEDNGIKSTLIIWDGMLDIEIYSSAIRYLSSRGRKVVLVGTSYLLDSPENDKLFIKAPAKLLDKEYEEFISFLNNIADELGDLVSNRISGPDKHFLVALYRLLPTTRRNISLLLNREFKASEAKVRNTAKEKYIHESNTLAHALFDAGLIKEEDILLESSISVDGDEFTEAAELINLVMVPGRFGLFLPFDLLIHSLAKSWMDNFVEVLSELDIFRWDQDQVGNIFIGPRHPLEAEIIVNSNLGSPQAEVSFAKKLLIEVQPQNKFDTSEETFAVDLLRSFGPNGPRRNYYAHCWMDILDVLEKLRKERGIENPRIMLQEASILREWVIYNDKQNKPLENGNKLLIKAQKILERALEISDESRRSEKLSSTILVELGANKASQTKGSISIGNNSRSYKSYRDTKEYLIRALTQSPEDFHPIDVLYWTTNDIISSNILGDETEAELLADLLHIFSTYDWESLNMSQQVRYQKRKYQLGQLLKDQSIADDAFAELISMGSKAGYYMKAVNIAGDFIFDDKKFPIRKSLRNQYEKAFNYLEDNRKEIDGDVKCLLLLLKLWWIIKTNLPMFYGERQTVSFNSSDWRYVNELSKNLLNSGDLYFSSKVRFINGLSSFHLNDIRTASKIFSKLQRESENLPGRRRIIRSYLASTPEGRPRIFHGSVKWLDLDRNKGEIYVEELLHSIPFIPLDFPKGRHLKKHDPLSDFHVAFNFIGMIADPKGYYRAKNA